MRLSKFNRILKRESINRIVVVLSLITVLVMPSMTKAIHVYEIFDHYSACNNKELEEHSEHDCNTCLICQFVLAPFTKVEPIIPEIIYDILYCDLQTSYQRVEYKTAYKLYNLRAPPMLS